MDLRVSNLFGSPAIANISEIMNHQQKAESKPQPFGKTAAEAIFPAHDVQPTNQFATFPKDEIEQSIPDRFEKMVQKIVRQAPDQTGN